MQIDPVKVAWIIRQKENGVRNSVIAGAMKVSVRRVQKIYSLYRATEAIPELKRPGRKSIEPSQDEMDLITNAYNEHRTGALIIERIIDVVYSKHIPHNRIHKVTKSMGIARDAPRTQIRKKWIQYERKYSNSLWHTDWKLIDGLGWFTAYLDDASRYIAGHALFPKPLQSIRWRC